MSKEPTKQEKQDFICNVLMKEIVKAAKITCCAKHAYIALSVAAELYKADAADSGEDLNEMEAEFQRQLERAIKTANEGNERTKKILEALKRIFK